ncbi:L,D-transpeptidase family protein [Desulfolutivibrio sp.]|uniref:L,D-transpeptidase family protein n=1 Tax=Desulfolutivibrio sp. TaxID=2773296 RepID=UPI002F968247
MYGFRSVAAALAAMCLFLAVSCARKPTAPAAPPSPAVAAKPAPASLDDLARVRPLDHSRQLVLVVTRDYDSITGVLAFFERDSAGAPWRRVIAPFPVTVGRSGLAFGRGLHGDGPSLPGIPAKHEGDGKAPAGAFALTMGFSYDPKALGFSPNMPMHTVTADTICVENSDSRKYNMVFNESTAGPADWSGPDRMLRPDGLYKNGLFVAHNTDPAAPGAGSCIFIHSWRGPDSPTAGCTAMEPGRVAALLRLLDAAKSPVMVQLPREARDRLAGAWGLPDLAAAGL